MLVAHFVMWPGGNRDRAYPLSLATFTLVGVAREDAPALGVRKGERAYDVRLFKDVQFGGPDGTGSLERAPIWRRGSVRGHVPGTRGVTDLVGGALKNLLGPRLAPYVPVGGTRVFLPALGDGDADLPPCCRLGETPVRAEVLYVTHVRAGSRPGRDAKGEPLPAWADLTDDDRARWDAVARIAATDP